MVVCEEYIQELNPSSDKPCVAVPDGQRGLGPTPSSVPTFPMRLALGAAALLAACAGEQDLEDERLSTAFRIREALQMTPGSDWLDKRLEWHLVEPRGLGLYVPGSMNRPGVFFQTQTSFPHVPPAAQAGEIVSIGDPFIFPGINGIDEFFFERDEPLSEEEQETLESALTFCSQPFSKLELPPLVEWQAALVHELAHLDHDKREFGAYREECDCYLADGFITEAISDKEIILFIATRYQPSQVAAALLEKFNGDQNHPDFATWAPGGMLYENDLKIVRAHISAVDELSHSNRRSIALTYLRNLENFMSGSGEYADLFHS